MRSQLAMTWGVETFKTEMVEHTDEMVRQVDEQLLRIGRVKEGDLVVIIAGAPPGIPGSTNALRVHRMGDAINEVGSGVPEPVSPSASTNADGSGWSSGACRMTVSAPARASSAVQVEIWSARAAGCLLVSSSV